jgi:hypothetical protein
LWLRGDEEEAEERSLMVVKSNNICGVILWFLLMRGSVREIGGEV